MAYSLPAPGEPNWGNKINNSLEYVRGVAEAAKATADSAISTADTSRNRVDSMGTDTGSRVSDAIKNDPTVQSTLSASIAQSALPKWQPNTAYAAGASVLAPDGSLVKAKTAFTSGTTYNAANWTSVASTAGGQAASTYAAARPGLYIPSPGTLSKWRAAQSRSRDAGGYARINVYGDSVPWGSFTTGKRYNNSWVARLRAMLATKTGQATGTGFVILTDSNLTSDEDRVTVPTWTRAGFGPFASSALNAASTSATFTAADVDSFTAYFLTVSGAGSVGLSVDGGAATSYSLNAANGFVAKTISAGSAGTHTLTITPSGSTWLVGVEGTKGTTGIRVSNVSLGGSYAGQLADDANGPIGSLQTAISSQFAPDLSIFTFGINDYFLTSQTPALYRTAMTTLINRAKTFGDVLLLAPYTFDGTPPSDGDLAQNYRDIMREYADSLGCAYLDLSQRWPTDVTVAFNEPYGFFGPTDRVHPSSRGHWDIAQAVYDAIV